jgi:two-component system LytT family response regulator
MDHIKAIIVDDEKMARVLLDGLIKRYCPEVEVFELCADLPTAVKAIIKHKPDLVFLDIEMPGHSGLELLDFFDDEAISFSIIFTTAYNQYAIQAFKLSAVDYLLKPLDPEDVKRAVELFKKRNRNQVSNLMGLKENMKLSVSQQKIAINSINSTKYIEVSAIAYFKADGSYTDIVLQSGEKITTSKGLKHFEDLLLSRPEFMRIQKSFIANLNCVTEYLKSDGGQLAMGALGNIPISMDKSAELSKRLGIINQLL